MAALVNTDSEGRYNENALSLPYFNQITRNMNKKINSDTWRNSSLDYQK